MTLIFNKHNNKSDNIKAALTVNLRYYTIITICAALLGYLTNNVTLAIFTVVIQHLWSYFSHKWGHYIFPLNIFHMIHHKPEESHKWYNELIETMVNFFGSGGLMLIIPNLLIKKYTGIQVLDNYVLLFTSFLYTSIHMINYHVKEVPTHKTHHKSDTTNETVVNFGPDIFDIIFDTKKNSEVYEDINHGIQNALIITIVIILLFKSKYDILDILEAKM